MRCWVVTWIRSSSSQNLCLFSSRTIQRRGWNWKLTFPHVFKFHSRGLIAQTSRARSVSETDRRDRRVRWERPRRLTDTIGTHSHISTDNAALQCPFHRRPNGTAMLPYTGILPARSQYPFLQGWRDVSRNQSWIRYDWYGSAMTQWLLGVLGWVLVKVRTLPKKDQRLTCIIERLVSSRPVSLCVHLESIWFRVWNSKLFFFSNLILFFWISNNNQ